MAIGPRSLFAAPAVATLFLSCSGGTPVDDHGASTNAAPTTAVQSASATTSTAASTTGEVPASSASATATLAPEPEYGIEQLRKCCNALAVRRVGLVSPPRAAVIRECKGHVELARRGEKTPLQGLKDLHTLHTNWPQECNIPQDGE